VAVPQHEPLRYSPPKGRLVVLLAVCLLAAALGAIVVILNLDDTVNLVIGVAAVGLFGIGGGVSIIGQLVTPTLVAAGEGLRVGRAGTVAWSDVDRIGTTAQGKLGIRLTRADGLLVGRRALTEEELRRTRAAEGYDLVFTERELGASPKDAAAALRRFRS